MSPLSHGELRQMEEAANNRAHSVTPARPAATPFLSPTGRNTGALR